MKDCTKCHRRQPLEEFSLQTGHTKDGRRAQCKTCIRAYAKERRKAYPGLVRDAHRRWKRRNPQAADEAKLKSKLKISYDLTLDRYREMLSEQQGRCCICELTMEKPCVDHDHGTGKIRGLLCSACNLVLGHAGDSAERLRRAADYLTQQS